MLITMTLVLRDTDKTFMAETETLENSSETRRDVGYVSRPSRDRDVETETTSLANTDVHGLLFTRSGALVFLEPETRPRYVQTELF